MYQVQCQLFAWAPVNLHNNLIKTIITSWAINPLRLRETGCSTLTPDPPQTECTGLKHRHSASPTAWGFPGKQYDQPSRSEWKTSFSLRFREWFPGCSLEARRRQSPRAPPFSWLHPWHRITRRTNCFPHFTTGGPLARPLGPQASIFSL